MVQACHEKLYSCRFCQEIPCF